MGRHESTRKWVKRQSEGTRTSAGNEDGKRRKISPKDPSDANATPLASQGKMVNMSVVHGPRYLAMPTEDTAFTFPYQPLDSSKSEIGIIILEPGTASSPLKCNLQHVSNANKSRASYKALSYTWGPPEPTKLLSLDEIQIQVRENLWQALYHIRQEDASLRLWVDALCINQEDIPERNEQVSRMGILYNQAQEVIVWLGSEKDESDIAISFIKNTVTPPSRGLALDLSSDLFSLVEIRSVLSLLSREYWTRVWIIQEVFRARKILICCGDERLPWKDLAKFFRQVKNLPDNDLRQIAMRPSREAITAISHNPAATLTDHRTTQFEDLESLLMSYDGSYCCDPRDKVYALLGLARKRQLTNRSKRLVERDWLTIDYSRSPRDLFQELTLMYLAEDLTPPWTTLPAPLPATSVGWFSCKTYIPARVSSVGPKFTWYPDVQKPSQEFSPQNLQPKQSPALSEHAALSKWYSQFLGPRMPSRPRLESALENLGEGDVARLESFKHAAWLTRSAQPRKPDSHLVYTVSEAHATEIRLFTTRTGRLGLTSCDIEESDKIIRFYGSDVALVVPKLPPSTYPAVEQRVKGRALIVASDKTGRNPDFLASYNAKFRWAVPSSLDDVDRWFNDCDSWSDIIEGKYGKPRLDMVAPDHSLQPEVERFDEMRVETYETTLTSN